MFKKFIRKIKVAGKELLIDKSGEQMSGLLIVIIITVIVGGIVLAFLTNMFGDLGPLVVNKVKSIFSL